MTDSERLARIERIVMKLAEKQGIDLGEAKEPSAAGYERAIQALAAGNKKVLENYIKQGGKIPQTT